MCIDFRCNRTVISKMVNRKGRFISPIVISGESVDQVDSFKYLGVALDKKQIYCSSQSMLQPRRRNLGSDCIFFESCELSMSSMSLL